MDARDGLAPDQALDQVDLPEYQEYLDAYPGIETMADNLANAKNACRRSRSGLTDLQASVRPSRRSCWAGCSPRKRWTRPHRKPMRCSPSHLIR